MPGGPRASRCSSRVVVDVYWYIDPVLVNDDVAEWLGEMVLETLKKDPRRRWTPWNEPLIRAEVASYIRHARDGMLVPVKQVKSIERAPAEYIFEIRMDLQVSQVAENGRPGFKRAFVRAYHTEPSYLQDLIVGLHFHEKEIVAGDSEETKRLQNVEIDLAVERFHEGEPRNWGV